MSDLDLAYIHLSLADLEKLAALTPLNISAAKRRGFQSKGFTMPDGSFPIPNMNYLKRAMQSFGRAAQSKRAAVKSHILKHARRLKAGADIIKRIMALGTGTSAVAASALYDGKVVSLASAKKNVVDAEDVKDKGVDETTEDVPASQLHPGDVVSHKNHTGGVQHTVQGTSQYNGGDVSIRTKNNSTGKDHSFSSDPTDKFKKHGTDHSSVHMYSGTEYPSAEPEPGGSLEKIVKLTRGA